MTQDTGWPSAIQHRTRVEFMRSHDEFRPECACGWVGSYWPLRNPAEDEAAGHVTANLFGAEVSR